MFAEGRGEGELGALLAAHRRAGVPLAVAGEHGGDVAERAVALKVLVVENELHDLRHRSARSDGRGASSRASASTGTPRVDRHLQAIPEL